MTTALLIAVAAGMFAVELLFLPLPGIQQDEAVFVAPYLSGVPIFFSIQLGDVPVPVMALEYVGMTKSWLYWPIFAIWEPGVWSMRLPVCFVGVLTLLVFAATVRRASSGPLAVCAALLLATDATFLLTNTFDWGPVCLLLLATAGISFFLQRFVATGRRGLLAAAFFIAGVAVWHKALFFAVLVGMAAGWVTAFHEQVRPRLVWRNFVVASLAFCLGAAPLIAFNIHAPLATFRAAQQLPPTPFSEKLMMLRNTLNGRALEHYMIRSEPGERIPLTGAPLEELVESWYRETSLFPGSFLLGGLVLSLLVFPFLGRSRLFPLLLFGWVASGVAAGLMLAFRSAGGGPHHTVLLYPAPHLLVAGTAFALLERFRKALLLAVAGCALVAASNLLLLAQYHSAARSNGFSVYWTDALDNLAAAVRESPLPVVAL
ncbi:MAG TPA: glycosyltransferase family 39 protein, partial [Terriglobia bacterium]|nr:glycosyltransferase family 39 protein [Terriglobia bacterium]